MSKRRDAAVVSYNMSRIRGKDTSAEVRLRRALWVSGLRFRKHYKEAPGSPDVAFPGAKIAVFCDGVFWHGHNWKERRDKLARNKEYWIAKIERNMERDARVNQELSDAGWLVLRFWDTEIAKNLRGCVETIKKSVEERRRTW